MGFGRMLLSEEAANRRLLKAFESGDGDVIRREIRDCLISGADRNMRLADGTPILSVAVQLSPQQSYASVCLDDLLQAGADPDACDFNGETALFHAPNADSVHKLVAFGADVRAQRADGSRAVDVLKKSVKKHEAAWPYLQDAHAACHYYTWLEDAFEYGTFRYEEWLQQKQQLIGEKSSLPPARLSEIWRGCFWKMLELGAASSLLTKADIFSVKSAEALRDTPGRWSERAISHLLMIGERSGSPITGGDLDQATIFQELVAKKEIGILLRNPYWTPERFPQMMSFITSLLPEQREVLFQEPRAIAGVSMQFKAWVDSGEAVALGGAGTQKVLQQVPPEVQRYLGNWRQLVLNISRQQASQYQGRG